ncbi:MAG: hypothetical protein U0869_22740 [Chloroflexota bacterium]
MDGWVEVRRASDSELLGYIRLEPDGRWTALTVFGGTLAVAATERDARATVERDGLASLARHWYHRRRGETEWRAVLVTEAWPGRARLIEGWYALPGAERFTITAADLIAGDDLTLEEPA